MEKKDYRFRIWTPDMLCTPEYMEMKENITSVKDLSERLVVWIPMMEIEAVKDYFKELITENGQIWLEPLLSSIIVNPKRPLEICVDDGFRERRFNYGYLNLFEDEIYVTVYLETVQKREEKDKLKFIYNLILINGRGFEHELDLRNTLVEKMEEGGIDMLRDYLEEYGTWVFYAEILFSRKKLFGR